MSIAPCPAKCGKRFIDAAHAESHADREHPDWRTPKRKGWCTAHGFVDFAHPVTEAEANETAKRIAESLFKKEKV
jgi:hypothetical protein